MPDLQTCERRLRKSLRKIERGRFEIGPLHRFGPFKGPMKTVCRRARVMAGEPKKLRRYVARLRSPRNQVFGPIFHGAANDLSTSKLGPEWTMAEELEATLRPVRWLWPTWMQKGRLTIVAGAAGVGKSAFVLRLCDSVINGASWPDQKPGPKKRTRVVWVEAEQRDSLNAGRHQRFGIPANQVVLHRPPGEFRLDDPDSLKSLRGAIKAVKPGLVVIDSLGAGHTRHENSAEVGRIIQRMDRLAEETNVAIVLVHHLRKPPTSRAPGRLTLAELRGSSTIGDRPQSVVGIDLPDAIGDRHHRRVSHVKSNAGEEQPSLGMQWAGDKLVFNSHPPLPPSGGRSP